MDQILSSWVSFDAKFDGEYCTVLSYEFPYKLIMQSSTIVHNLGIKTPMSESTELKSNEDMTMHSSASQLMKETKEHVSYSAAPLAGPTCKSKEPNDIYLPTIMITYNVT